MPTDILIKLISSNETHPLRHKILRPHQSLSEMAYPQDELAEATHFGAYRDDTIVGIISIYPENLEGQYSPSEWRIRGMAVEKDYQGCGLGRKILKTCIEYAKTQGVQSVWCNARTSAIGFYLSFGFTQVGEEFIIDGIGPHYIAMLKPI